MDHDDDTSPYYPRVSDISFFALLHVPQPFALIQ